MSSPKVSIIIVGFNTKEDLRQCLCSLQREQFSLEVFVVDNVSKDGTREMLTKEFAGWPALKTVHNEENVGFARASNQPISWCRGKYILFLNPDTIVTPGAINTMVDFLDAHPNVGVVGPKLLYENGSLQVSCGSSWGISDIITWHFLPVSFSHAIDRRRCENWARYEQKDVGWVSGACLMIRRELALELGGFDEEFFLSQDDAADLCLRVLKKGYRVVYYPKATITHLAGTSFRDIRPFALLNAYLGHIHFTKKHYGNRLALLLRGVLLPFSLIKMMRAGVIAIARPKYRQVFHAHILVIKVLILPAYKARNIRDATK